MNDKYKAKIDNNDSRYVKLRKSLKDDISQKVQCEDYDKIIDYIFALVFEHNKSKDEVRKEMEEIFAESSDYIMDLLTKLLEKHYGNTKDENSNDLIEEIYEDKPSGSKSLSSQVVKPASQQESKASKNIYNQAINSVKESGRRRESRNDYQNPRNKYDQNDEQQYGGNQYYNNNNNYPQQQDRRYNNNYNNPNPNYNNYNNHRYNNQNYNQNSNYPNPNYNNYNSNNYNDDYNSNQRYDNRRNRGQGPYQNQQLQHQNQYQQQSRKGSYNANQPGGSSREENINVGGRNLVIKKRRDNKTSASRSRSFERERSKEKEKSGNANDNKITTNETKINNNNLAENQNYQQQYQLHYQQHFQQQPHIFGQNYQTQYPSDPRRQYINSNYFQPARGPLYQMRRLGPFNARGRFPGRFIKQRYLGPMNMARKTNIPAAVKEGTKPEDHAETEQNQANAQENQGAGAQQNTETPENKPTQVNQAHHTPAEAVGEEKDKKKIRCRNWPNCKNDNCEYAHPTETCQYFPKCQFGTKCLFIHPNIPCKYGFYCTRPGCSYSHGSGYNPGMFGMMPPTMQPFNANKFKKFHPKTGPKPGANPAAPAASNQSNQAESTPAIQEDTQMVADNFENINA